MSTDSTLYVCGHTRWDFLGNPATELSVAMAARGRRVVHTTGPLSLWHRGRSQWRSAGLRGSLESVRGVLVDRPGRLPPLWPPNDRWTEFVLGRHGARLRRGASDDRADRRVAIVCHPRMLRCAIHLGPRYLLFYAVDRYRDQPGWRASLETPLHELVRRSDLLLCANRSAVDAFRAEARQPPRLFPSAVNIEPILAAAATPCPADLASIPRPRIGYVGRLNAKVDFEMIAWVAGRRPDWRWVLIGPIASPWVGPSERSPGLLEASSHAERWLDACRRLPNVHFLGYRSPDRVARYLTHMDVNTICYNLRVGPWTRTAYPFKVHECLAAGPPVVSAMTDELRRHADVVDLAETPEQWLRALERAIARGGVATPESRRAVARLNTWGVRARQLDGWIDDLMSDAPS